ncbi:hypothetical protein Q2K19_22670 [Micromonospora soli]|uniref:hypothetical protein n=1 Tax=Micromonospora sp. NBRC 110009 TaxID=3061627 RepID=UPI0026737C9C|nr:hypothetical protein [Micromonospora sp. NBRC 110009]WKT96970.1 hypothetical protein Q2K19_22670 [Micromonospora sp. NBRC 110009]
MFLLQGSGSPVSLGAVDAAQDLLLDLQLGDLLPRLTQFLAHRRRPVAGPPDMTMP